MSSKPFFSKELFRFLKDLKRNNRREWFEANRDRYEVFVKMPLLGFIGAMSRPLSGVSGAFTADSRPNGGSMFRIYRDTRFSKDKTPYKTHAAAQFRHKAGRDVHAPGFYLHLEPGGVFAGGGLWRPDAPALGQIRDAIVADPTGWKTVLADKRFRKSCTIEGDKLVRPPKGYDPNHPLIEWLKYKDFVFFSGFTEKDAVTGGFLEKVLSAFQAGQRYTAFLCKAMGVEF